MTERPFVIIGFELKTQIIDFKTQVFEVNTRHSLEYIKQQRAFPDSVDRIKTIMDTMPHEFRVFKKPIRTPAETGFKYISTVTVVFTDKLNVPIQGVSKLSSYTDSNGYQTVQGHTKDFYKFLGVPTIEVYKGRYAPYVTKQDQNATKILKELNCNKGDWFMNTDEGIVFVGSSTIAVADEQLTSIVGNCTIGMSEPETVTPPEQEAKHSFLQDDRQLAPIPEDRTEYGNSIHKLYEQAIKEGVDFKDLRKISEVPLPKADHSEANKISKRRRLF